jgi:hypothetical protein
MSAMPASAISSSLRDSDAKSVIEETPVFYEHVVELLDEMAGQLLLAGFPRGRPTATFGRIRRRSW